MSIPSDVKNGICAKIWKIADSIGWLGLTNTEKSQYYRNWARADEIGGVLAKYMDVERVHPYIKDSIMKPYAKQKTLSEEDVLRIAGFSSSAHTVVDRNVKPFTLTLSSHDIIAWGRAVDWKIILLSLVERTHGTASKPACVILTSSSGKFSSEDFKGLVRLCAKKLSISNVFFI